MKLSKFFSIVSMGMGTLLIAAEHYKKQKEIKNAYNKMGKLKNHLYREYDELTDDPELLDLCVNKFTEKNIEYINIWSKHSITEHFDVFMLCEFDDIRKKFLSA